jgi:adenylylsulfate kinase
LSEVYKCPIINFRRMLPWAMNGYLFLPRFLGTMAWVVWVTGLPGCGKTTIAQRAKAELLGTGIKAKVLQLDEIRSVVTPNPKYTEEERDVVYASLAYMAKLLSEEGVNVIIDATANRRRYRDLARSLIPKFAEIYIKATLEVCMQRELERKAKFAPKDIYKKAEKGALVPGVGVSYEEPLDPEIVVDTLKMNADQGAKLVAEKIKELFEG